MAEAADLSSPYVHDAGTVTRRLYLWAVTAAGAGALALSTVQLLAAPPDAMYLVLAALTIVASVATIRLPGFPASFSLSDTFTITAALLFGPAAGALLVALDGLVISGRLSAETRTATRVLFNVTAPALAMWLAAQLFFLIIGRAPLSAPPGPTLGIIAPLVAFATAYFVVNTGLIAGAIAIGRSSSLTRVWRTHLLPLGLTHFGGTSIAALLLLVIGAGLVRLQTLTYVLPLVAVLLFAVLSGVAWVRSRSAQFADLRPMPRR